MGCERQPFEHGRRLSVGRAAAKEPFNAQTTEWSFLSVVVPAKNEAASLFQLVNEIVSALRPLRDSGHDDLMDFEIIVVDDGSTDATRFVLRDLAVAYRELRGLILPMTVGQSAATMVGIHAARGEWIATLDGDLQNDPNDLARLWRALPGENFAVLGWRVNRQDVWSKRIFSYWANRLRNIVLRQSIRDTGCSVRIFPRTLALRLPMFHGMHRFYGPLLLREGCELIQVPVHHRARFHGRSHYNLWNRSLEVALDLFGVAWLMSRSLQTKTRGGAMYQVEPANDPRLGSECVSSHQGPEN
jgi:dolichol-phosphate mannosyltransferase